MKYLMTMFMSVIVLTFVACGDKDEDTAAAEDTSVLETESDAGDGEEGSDAGSEDTGAGEDGDSNDE